MKTKWCIPCGKVSSTIVIIVFKSNNNKFVETYERKGKLQKKSLNNDKFKER